MLELSGYSNEFSEGIKEIKIREKESFKQWVKAKEKIEQRLEYF